MLVVLASDDGSVVSGAQPVNALYTDICFLLLKVSEAVQQRLSKGERRPLKKFKQFVNYGFVRKFSCWTCLSGCWWMRDRLGGGGAYSQTLFKY